VNELENTVDQSHSWALTYDKPCGMKDVVFQTFAKKPSAEEFNEAVKIKSDSVGYEVEAMLWGDLSNLGINGGLGRCGG